MLHHPYVTYVVKLVAKDFGIRPQQLMSSRRSREFSYPRMLAIYLVRASTDRSLTWIGEKFGGLHHTSVMHACEWAVGKAEFSEYLRSTLQHLKEIK